MSAAELSRIRARIEALDTRAKAAEDRMDAIVEQLGRIEQTIAAMKKEHEDMMQAKADLLRQSVLAEIRASAEVIQRELAQTVHGTVRQCVKTSLAARALQTSSST